jgi:hypothetical protein
MHAEAAIEQASRTLHHASLSIQVSKGRKAYNFGDDPLALVITARKGTLQREAVPLRLQARVTFLTERFPAQRN